jgi:nitrite reductase (NADH) large subunit
MKQKLIIIGNGMAGARTLEELLRLAPDKYEITVFGAEPYGDYNRILLSSVLAGEKTLDDIMLHDRQWYAQRGVTLLTGKEVVSIDRAGQSVMSSDGAIRHYDRLLLATGSEPIVLPVPGHYLPGVITFRDIDDVHAMMDAARTGNKRAVVIGGGLLGLEAASGLLKQGMQVTVVHLSATLMNRQLDTAAARLLQQNLVDRGMNFLLQAETAEIIGDEQVQAVGFSNGLQIPADLVVMAVGIRPNIGLAKTAGLRCEHGIVVNDTLQTYDPKIYAAGECIQHRGLSYGLVTPIWEQARVCANHLAEWGIASYPGSTPATSLKVSGIDLFSAGDFQGDETSETIRLKDPCGGHYKKLVIKENRLQGAVLYGDVIDGPWYMQLIETKTDISAIREQLIFGQIKPDHPAAARAV